jgi:phage terminase small subunit
MAELKPKEERFCQEYVIDYNGTQGAIRARYKESDAANRATRLLKKAEVSARIHELEKEIAQRLGLSQDYVMIQLVQRYDECRTQNDNKNALKALELIGKHLGMFEKTKPADGKDNDRLEDML